MVKNPDENILLTPWKKMRGGLGEPGAACVLVSTTARL